jgi:hypothetical protein
MVMVLKGENLGKRYKCDIYTHRRSRLEVARPMRTFTLTWNCNVGTLAQYATGSLVPGGITKNCIVCVMNFRGLKRFSVPPIPYLLTNALKKAGQPVKCNAQTLRFSVANIVATKCNTVLHNYFNCLAYTLSSHQDQKITSSTHKMAADSPWWLQQNDVIATACLLPEV